MMLAFIYAALVVAGAVSMHAAFAMPQEYAAPDIAHFARYRTSLQWGSFLELASAMPFGIFVAAVVSRLRFLGVRAAGELIALCGGIVAMVMLIVSALAVWGLSSPSVTGAAGAVSVFQLLSFGAGGPGFVATLGLFVAGVSVAAGLHRFIPRWLMWLGIFVAVASELSTLMLLVWNAAYFIPVGRFISIIWMIGVAATLPISIPSNQDLAISPAD
ncbi:MAG: hypothetical protein ACRD4S_03255 [Candidatus Acidiferrales bacterium]